MPPKKKGRQVKLPKIDQQKIHITKRLMDISLKVDHYIYKNRPISSAAATLYLQEVTSYQAICIRDVRSLQVIEKLSRIMQAIIEEQRRNCDAINYDYGSKTPIVENRGASPVYSLTEEDKLEMQISGITVNNNRLDCVDKENTTFESEKENEQSTNSPPCKALSILSSVNFHECNNQINDTDTIDLCSNDGQVDTENTNNSDRQTEKQTLNNSDVIFNEYGNRNLDVESELCSQSILNTWTVSETNDLLILPVEQYGQDMGEVDKALKTLMNQTQIVSTIKENNSSCNENHNKNKANVKVNRPVGILKNTKESSKVNISNQVKIPTKKTRKRVLKNAETNKEGNSKKKPKPNNTVNKDNCKEVKLPVALNTSVSTYTKIIQNCNLVEADLSWIENIKYVRQIYKDEYDPTLTTLCESFWKNCDLPPGWDDTDFNY